MTIDTSNVALHSNRFNDWMHRVAVALLCVATVASGTLVRAGVAGAAPTSWPVLPSPNPVGSSVSILNGVTCFNSTNCMAVGSSVIGGNPSTLVESWNGSTWSIIPSPIPSGSSSAALQAVSCVSATDCTAVGYSYPTNAITTLVESWNGSTWSIVPSPNPIGSTSSELQAVACSSTSSCAAVGYSYDGSSYTLAEVGSTPLAPTFTSASSDTIIQGASVDLEVASTGAPIPALSVSGALPHGVTFVDNGNGTAVLTGTAAPGTAGTYPITLTASNGVAPDATQSFTLTVTAIGITTPSLPGGTAKTTYSSPLAAIGGNLPYAWKITSGSLPKGFKLNRLTGVISGKTKQTGTITFTVEVLDTKIKVKGHPATQNTATTQLSITIAP